MPKNKAKGELDLGWDSYGVPKQTTADQNGNMETETWPSSVNRDELTDKQENVIETAFENPTLTTVKVGEKVGCHNTTVGKVLKENVPEWYENVFKQNGESQIGTKSWKKRSSSDEEADTQEDTEAAENVTRPTVGSNLKVHVAIEAMKATAQHEETISALEVVEDYV